MSRAPLRGRITAIVPEASHLHGTPRCFLQRGVPSRSSPQTWSWPAPSQPFQGPRLMTAPAPRPGSGTRTSSHHPSPLRRSSLAVQGPPALSLTPPTTMTTMTSAQPRPGQPRLLGWLRPSGLLLYLLPFPFPSLPAHLPMGLRVLSWRDGRKRHTSYCSVSIHQAKPAGTALPQPQIAAPGRMLPPTGVSPLSRA